MNYLEIILALQIRQIMTFYKKETVLDYLNIFHFIFISIPHMILLLRIIIQVKNLYTYVFIVI